MKPTIYIVPGILTKEKSDGAFHNFVADIFEQQGFEVVKCWYGWFTALLVRFRNNRAVKKLDKMIPHGSNVICHSNGGALVWKLYAKYGKRFNHVIMVQPALDPDKLIPDTHANSVSVLFNRKDRTVKLATIYRFFEWGNMGQTGANPKYGKLPSHYKNYDTENTRGMPSVSKHSWYTLYSGIEWIEKMAKKLKRKLSKESNVM